MNAPTLYHFTCEDHGAPGIRKKGLAIPHRGMTPTPVVWLTDDPDATREELGLSSHSLTCDRMQVLFAAEGCRRAMPWREYKALRGLMIGVRELLEVPGCDPAKWWVCERPVLVVEVPKGAAPNE